MATFVGAIGTSHSPPMFLEVPFWEKHSEITDRKNPELISPRTGKVTAYADLVREVNGDPAVLDELRPEVFAAKYERMQRGAERLREIVRELAPDRVMVVSDDQEELFFDDNMPSLSIYWGESWRLLPWKSHRPGAHPLFETFQRGWGDREADVPVDARMGEYLIQGLIQKDFDIAHFRYLRLEPYGGSIGPSGFVTERRERAPSKKGVPHGFAYVVKSVLDYQPIPMVPVFLNTCYPPNRPTGRRCYQFGAALRDLIDAYPGTERVLLIASGGLSHFVLDEELDRLLIKGLEDDDPAILANLPRMDSPTAEILNWVVAAGACRDRQFQLIDYVPTARSVAGTGGGWTFGQWVPKA